MQDPIESPDSLTPSRWRPTPGRRAHPWGEEESPVTSCLLEYAELLGAQSPLATWLAWALQRHQEASQEYYDRKLSELTASLDHAITAGHAGAQLREGGRDTGWPSAVLAPEAPVATMPAKQRVAVACCPPPSPASQFTPVMEGHDETTTPPEEAAPALERSTPARDVPTLPCPSPSATWLHDASSQRSKLAARSCTSTLACDVDLDSDSSDSLPDPYPTEVPTALQMVNYTGVVVVSVNAALIFMELEQQGIKVAGQLGMSPDWPQTGAGAWDSVFVVSDWIFALFYLVEMLAKNFFMQVRYWKNPMNVLDAFVALASVTDLVFQNVGTNTIVLARVTRIIQVTKLARLTRIVRASHELTSLFKTLYLSLKALLSTTVLLVLIVFIAGLAMAQFVGSFLLNDCAPDVPLCEWAYRHYGTALRSVWTMFQVTLSGGWPTWAGDLVEHVSAWYIVFWVVYIIVVWFGVLRVISALFLKETMEVAACDHEMVIREKMKKKTKYAAALRKFFVVVDKDNDGSIDHDEFREALADPHAKAWLQTLEIEESEIDALFQMLEDRDGKISFDELLASAVRMRGSVRASDQIAMLCNQRILLARVDAVLERLGSDSHRRGLSDGRSDGLTEHRCPVP